MDHLQARAYKLQSGLMWMPSGEQYVTIFISHSIKALISAFLPFSCSGAISLHWSVVLYELPNEAAAGKGDLSLWDITKSAWCLHSRWACRRPFCIPSQRKWGLLMRRCSEHKCCKCQRRAEVEICIQAQRCTPAHILNPGEVRLICSRFSQSIHQSGGWLNQDCKHRRRRAVI